ncbi:MAG: LAGLIDADG family homing endonuclease [Thermoleophilaceae bacterium]
MATSIRFRALRRRDDHDFYDGSVRSASEHVFVARLGGSFLASNRVAAAQRLDAPAAEWLAGFLDAEGCLRIRPNNRGTTWTCELKVKVRDDDAALIVDLHRSTGLGYVRPVAARGGSKPQAEWTIQTKDECAAFAALLRKHPLRGRKRLDAEIWCQAVATWAASPRRMSAADAARLTDLSDRLRQARRYTGNRMAAPVLARGSLADYFGGFFAGDGYLGLTDSRAVAVVKIRRDDRPLLELLSASLASDWSAT